MPRSIRPPTKSSIRELRARAFNALLGLHGSDPDALHELADSMDRWAAVHTAAAPMEICADCRVKRHTAALLRAVADLRELAQREMEADG